MVDRQQLEEKWNELVKAHGDFSSARDAHDAFREGKKVKHKRKHETYRRLEKKYLKNETQEFVDGIV